MDNTELNERKKAIAQWMGYTYYPYRVDDPAPDYCSNWNGWFKGDRVEADKVYIIGLNKSKFIARTTKKLPYDENWSALMQVVEEIENRADQDGFVPRITVDTKFCRIDCGDKKYELLNDLAGGKKMCLFTVVSDYIIDQLKNETF